MGAAVSQVDLFFYREPEETRPAEEEEGGLAAIEFGGSAPDFSSAPPLAGVAPLADANWDGGPPAGGDWEPAAAPVAAGGGGGGDWTAAAPGMCQVASGMMMTSRGISTEACMREGVTGDRKNLLWFERGSGFGEVLLTGPTCGFGESRGSSCCTRRVGAGWSPNCGWGVERAPNVCPGHA